MFSSLSKNEGTMDRILRMLLGIGLLATAFTGPKTLLGCLGVIPLATGMLGYCPLYSLARVSTRRRP